MSTPVTAEECAENLESELGLPSALRYARKLLSHLNDRATSVRDELNDALAVPGSANPARESSKRPAPPADQTEVGNRVVAALKDKPRSMRGIQAATGATPDQIQKALTGLGAAKHGQKWSLPL